MSEPLVIVGNGMAAARLVDEQLTRCALGRHAIAVIGDEPRLAYNRVLLSSVLAGETAPEDIELKPMSWWRDRGVTLKVGCPATEIDVGRREIKIANDESVSFSRLGLATGSAPLRLNVPGADLRANCSIPPISLSSTGSGIARFSPTFSAPHRRGDRIGWLLPVMALLQSGGRHCRCAMHTPSNKRAFPRTTVW